MDKKTIYIIIGAVILSIILIISVVIKASNEDVEEDIKLDIVYDANTMELISDHNLFFTLEKIVRNTVIDIYSGKYNNVLNAINIKYFEDADINEILRDLESFNAVMKENGYTISEKNNILYEVYKKSDGEYNCLFNIMGTIHYILIYLDNEEITYEIRDIEIMGVN